MHIEYHKWWSHHLNRDMELKVHGHAGRPFMVFPSQSGRFFDFENRGMMKTVEHFINEGRMKLFSVDSIDPESWDDTWKNPEQKAARHNDYDRYIVHEVIPFIHYHCKSSERVIATGVSMGATHAVNFFFRHPDVFGGTVALSGLYDMYDFIGYSGDNMDFYHNSPLNYLKDMTDEWYLDKYRHSNIIICTGQGAWEEIMVRDTRKLKEILDSKGVPAWIDFWGHDVNHDWPWWEKQFPHFVAHLV